MMILGGIPNAKAIIWILTDAETRKPGEQEGLDTLVVLAVNNGCYILDWISVCKITR